MSYIKLFLITASILMSGPAQAYLGPGAGLSAIGAILALLAAILLLVIGFFWYPIKRLLGKKSKKDIENRNTENSKSSVDDTDDHVQ